MAMQEDLVARLDGVGAIAALASGRIAWGERRRTSPSFPALVLTLVSPGRGWTHGGPHGLDQARMQFDCYALDAVTARALAAALQAEMELGGEEVPFAPKTVGGTVFHPGMLDAHRTFEAEALSNDARAYRESMDFLFYHEQV